MTNRPLFATLLALVLSATSDAQTLDKGKLDQFFDRLAEKNKAMGSLVVIAKDGRVLYSRAIGYSQISGAEKKPLTAATRYRIGSTTKMFTAAMILQLVDEGRLKLSDTLDKFFPQMPSAKRITILQLLAHRSGIRVDVQRDRDVPSDEKTKAITKEEMLAIIAKSKPEFEPDARHAYSNEGYVLLGYIVETVCEKPYQEALEERIASKIGLKDTYFGTGYTDAGKNESFSYRFGRDWELQSEIHPSLTAGAGAIVSTPSDLARFIQALFDGKIISNESFALMKTMRDGYGLGMEPFTHHGKTFYGHTGGGNNFGSWLAYVPEEKLALAYTSNAKVYPVAKIVSGVFDIYFNRPFTVPTFESIAIPPETLDQYVGVYSIPGAPFKFTVTRDGSTLFIQPGGQTVIPLEPMAVNKFEIESPPIEFEFDAALKQMRQRRGGRERIFTKE